MDHFWTGFEVALGACAGMVVWSCAMYVLKIVATIFAAVHARIFGPTFRNGKGEIVKPNDPNKKGGVK